MIYSAVDRNNLEIMYAGYIHIIVVALYLVTPPHTLKFFPVTYHTATKQHTTDCETHIGQKREKAHFIETTTGVCLEVRTFGNAASAEQQCRIPFSTCQDSHLPQKGMC